MTLVDPSDPDSSKKVRSVEGSLEELQQCWQRLQGQVDDKQARLEHTLHFHQLYQEALLNVSSWVDNIELRLFGSGFDKDTDQRLRDNEVGSAVVIKTLLKHETI